jgi:hypothetical protein
VWRIALTGVIAFFVMLFISAFATAGGLTADQLTCAAKNVHVAHHAAADIL